MTLLEYQMAQVQKAHERIDSRVVAMSSKVDKLESAASTLKWVIGIAVAIGPTLGVLIVKLFGGS